VVPALFMLLAPPQVGRKAWGLGLGLFSLTALVVGGLYGAPVTNDPSLFDAIPGGLALGAGLLVLIGAAAVLFWPPQSAATEPTEPDEVAPTWTLVLGAAAVARAILGFLSIKERIPG